MKKLAKKLEENGTASRCPALADCMEQVKKNKRPTALIHVKKPMSTQYQFLKKLSSVYFKAKWSNLIGNDG